MPGFLTTVVIAAVVGWIGNAITGHNMPGESWGAALSALVGAWIGAYAPIFNTVGPMLFRIAIIPTILGAAAATFILGLFKAAVKQRS